MINVWLRNCDGSRHNVPSPLEGEGQGGGYAARTVFASYPPPQPSPTRGEGARSNPPHWYYP